MRLHIVRATAVLATVTSTAAAQQRTSQPNLINISREIEKPFHSAAHAAVETRWAAAYREANSPFPNIALVAASGPQEVWWVTAYDSFDAMGKGNAFGSDIPGYTQKIAKIAMEDSDHITGQSTVQARAVREAGYGAYPDLSKMRVYSVMTVRMRPTFEGSFAEIAKHYAAMVGGSDAVGWRSYELVAGAPAGTFLVFSSFPSWAAVDANEAAMGRAMAAGAAHMEALGKLSREGVMSTDVRYFTVDPQMSTVTKEMAASDPFWAPKPVARAKKPAP